MLSKKIFNLPNILTILRVIIIPFLLIFLFYDTHMTNIVATLLFALASITDFVDGYLARKYEIVTTFGKILDPIADKILVASALVALVELHRVAAWVVIVILGRDFAVGALRNYASSTGVVISADMMGKVKTTVQMIATGCLIYKEPLLGLNIFLIGEILIYISLAISIQSGLDYYLKFFKNRKNV